MPLAKQPRRQIAFAWRGERLLAANHAAVGGPLACERVPLRHPRHAERGDVPFWLSADGTLYDPAILWELKDKIDQTTEYASKLAKWRKQYTNWHKDSARPLQLDEDAILEAIYAATPWYAPASSPPLPRMPPRALLYANPAQPSFRSGDKDDDVVQS